MIRRPLRALSSFLDRANAWRRGKVSFCSLTIISWLLMAQIAQISGHPSSLTILELCPLTEVCYYQDGTST